jgi:hypothetical protein
MRTMTPGPAPKIAHATRARSSFLRRGRRASGQVACDVAPPGRGRFRHRRRQSPSEILDLVRRIEGAHAAHPDLRFSLTIATLGNTDGNEGLDETGLRTLDAVATVFGSWPSFVTVNLMAMNYGTPSPSVCVVEDGRCDMGWSAVQSALNLHDRHGVPLSNIELTPLIGGNELQNNVFRPEDVEPMASLALASGLAGVHYWSFDRDIDCPPGPASPVCNTLGGVGPHGFLRAFHEAGLDLTARAHPPASR